MKRIFLKGTANLGMLFRRDEDSDLVGFSDSDWAGDSDDRRSTSGYLFKMCDTPISWKSKKQGSVALAPAEAEYVALASATQETIWLRHLTAEPKCESLKPTVIHEDNQAAISMVQNSVSWTLETH